MDRDRIIMTPPPTNTVTMQQVVERGEVFRLEWTDCRDYLEFRKGSGNTIEIYNIVVGSERRKGIGRKMIQELLNTFQDTELVWAITRADNAIAQQFYEALNFRVVGVLREFYDTRCQRIDAILYGRSPTGAV